MPDEELKGHWKPKSAKREVIPEHLKICVHQGSNEEMVAMATIDMDDLRSLVNLFLSICIKLLLHVQSNTVDLVIFARF